MKSRAFALWGVTTNQVLNAVEMVVLVGLGLFLYGDSVTLPFFFDDPVQFRCVEGSSFLGLWTGTGAYGYYRPLPFVLWKLSLWFTSPFRPALLHAINVALHILNAALVVVLTRRILPFPRHRMTGLAAGILFLSFPFSYQAVPWIGALTHLLVTSLVLGAVLTAITARSTSRWGWRVLSLVMAVAAFFAHEAGLTLGGWLLGYELMHRDDGKPWRISLWPLVYLALGVAYVPLYFAVPRAGSPFPPLTAGQLVQNGAYLLQGLAFPVAPLTRWTMEGWGWSDLSAAYLAGGLTIGILTFLNWRQGTLRAWGLALVCFMVTIVPSWLVLSFDYVINGPRLLYLASVGSTIAWACGFQALACLGRGAGFPACHHGWWRTCASGFTLLLLGLTVAFGCHFVRVRQAIYRLGGELIWQVSQAVSVTPEGERLLVVNCPAWLAPDRLVYPIGHEGVEFMPAYVGVGDLAWVNSGVSRQIRTAKFANTLVPLPGLYCGVRRPAVGWEGLAERLRAADQVYAVHLAPEALTLVRAGTLVEALATQGAPLAVFDARVALLAADVVSTADQTLTVQLVWQAQEPLTDADYRVFVHLYDASGALIAQSDGYPMDGLFPFWLWRPGERAEEVRYLALPASLPSSNYSVALGIYDGTSGKRLMALAANGVRFKDDAVPVSITGDGS